MDRAVSKFQEQPVSTAALGIVSAASTWYLYHVIKHALRQNFGTTPLPPGPTPLPMLGSLHLALGGSGPDGNNRIHIGLLDLVKRYGSIYGLWMGSYYTVVVSSPSIAHQLYCTHGKLTSDRAPMQSHGGDHVPSMYIATRNGKGIAMSTGEYWRRVRTYLETNISRKHIAEQNVPIVLEEVQSVVCCWRKMCEENKCITNLTSQLKRESMNVALRLLFSQRFATEDMDSREFKGLQYAVEFIFKNLSSGNPGDMIPIFRIFPTPMLWEMQRVVNERDILIDSMIEKHRTEFKSLRAEGKMKSVEDARDLVDLFFFDQERPEVKKRMNHDEVHVVVWDIIFAMTDTTATTNEWLIYYLINYPRVQRKVHEELDRVIGSERLPTLEDRHQLPYFWAVLKEVMRIKTVSPLLAPHYASEDVVVVDDQGQKRLIPRGTGIFMHAWSMAMDEKYWGDPEVFRPERWLEDERNKGLDLHGKESRQEIEHYKYIPFSLGPRTCPGYSFAKVALFMQAATTMHCFEWRLSHKSVGHPKVKGGQLDLTECWGLTIMPDRYGEEGLIEAQPRPAARLAQNN